MHQVLRTAVFLLCFFSASLAFAQTPERSANMVTAEGVAVVHKGAIKSARDAAIEDAQKRAVEQAIGIMIDFYNQVEYFPEMSNKILSQFKGYIRRYHILGQKQDSGLLRVQISAEVSHAKLRDDLSAIGVRMSGKERPQTRPVSITIIGLTKNEFARFKDILRNQVQGIRDLHEQSFIGTTARISVDSTRGSQELAHELGIRDLGTFSVEVTASTASSLELKVSPNRPRR